MPMKPATAPLAPCIRAPHPWLLGRPSWAGRVPHPWAAGCSPWGSSSSSLGRDSSGHGLLPVDFRKTYEPAPQMLGMQGHQTFPERLLSSWLLLEEWVPAPGAMQTREGGDRKSMGQRDHPYTQ